MKSNILLYTNPKPGDNFFTRLFYGEQKDVFKPMTMKWYNVKAEDYGEADKK